MRPRKALAFLIILLQAGLASLGHGPGLMAATPLVKVTAKAKAPAQFPADLHDQLRALASRVESEQAANNPETKGLAARVEALLQQKSPPPLQGYLQFIRLPSGALDLTPTTSTTSGLIFNGSPQGTMAEITELEASLSSARNSMPLRFRLGTLMTGQREMDSKKVEASQNEALALARKQVEAEPENAMAHAWLADCLFSFWPRTRAEEARTAATKALELDSNCWRAHLVLGLAAMDRAKFELLPRGAPAAGEPLPEFDAFLHAIHDQPPGDQQLAAMEQAIGAAMAQIDKACTVAPSEPEPLLRRSASQQAITLNRALANLAREAQPSSFEAIKGLFSGARQVSLHQDPKIFTELRGAPELRAHDPQLLAAATVLYLAPAIMSIGLDPNPRTFHERDRKLIDDALGKLEKMGNIPNKMQASKAHEARAVLQALTLELAGEPTRIPEACLKALALDYRRHSAWELLTFSLAGAKRLEACNAAMEIRLALWPYPYWHFQRAAIAAKVQDWELSKKHLSTVLAARPDDIPAKLGLAAVRLCQAAEQNAPEAVKQDFETLRDLYGTNTSSFGRRDGEDFVINLIVFMCLQRQYAAAEELIRSCVEDGRLPPRIADGIRAEMKK